MSNNRMLSEANVALQKGQAAPTGRELTLTDVLFKTAACLAVVIIAAVPGAVFLKGNFIIYVGVMIVAMIAGVMMMKRAPISAPLALGYSALLGLVVGGFTASAVAYGGNVAIIPQAVIGTAAGTVGMLALYMTPWGRKQSKNLKLLFGLIIGYVIIGFVNIIVAMMGVGNGWGLYGVGGWGILLCLFGVALACWSLLADIGMTDRAINAKADAAYDWTFAASLSASIVWLYLELVRLLGISGR